jgi:DNA repair protein RadC
VSFSLTVGSMTSGTDSAQNEARAKRSSARRRELLVERLLRDPLRGLNEAELLELLLSSCTRLPTAKPLAEELLGAFGSLRGILDASTVELRTFKRAGLQVAALVRLIREIVERCSALPLLPAEVLSHPQELQRYLVARMGAMRGEAILLVFLNSQGILLGEELLGAGTLDQTVMFPRQVMERALHFNAASLVIIHNHPHGPPLPSARDREEAERLRDVMRPFDIRVLDAIVVGQTRCFSIFNNAPL